MQGYPDPVRKNSKAGNNRSIAGQGYVHLLHIVSRLCIFCYVGAKKVSVCTHGSLVQVPEGPPGTEQASLSPDHHCQGGEEPVGGVHGHRRQGTQRTVKSSTSTGPTLGPLVPILS
jgi:hypothetical protein